MYNNLYNQNMYNPYNKYQPMSVPAQPMQNQQFIQPISPQSNLLGKIVDSIDVVKATDIPLDGSTSYFPLTDGSAIVTKKLQMDGTSRTIIYKPVVEDNVKRIEEPINDVNFALQKDFVRLQDELDNLRKELDKLKEAKKKETK